MKTNMIINYVLIPMLNEDNARYGTLVCRIPKTAILQPEHYDKGNFLSNCYDVLPQSMLMPNESGDLWNQVSFTKASSLKEAWDMYWSE
jgi:hypothetical protein